MISVSSSRKKEVRTELGWTPACNSGIPNESSVEPLDTQKVLISALPLISIAVLRFWTAMSCHFSFTCSSLAKASEQWIIPHLDAVHTHTLDKATRSLPSIPENQTIEPQALEIIRGFLSNLERHTIEPHVFEIKRRPHLSRG